LSYRRNFAGPDARQNHRFSSHALFRLPVHHMPAAPTTIFLYFQFLFGQFFVGCRAVIPPFAFGASQGYLFARHDVLLRLVQTSRMGRNIALCPCVR